MTFIENLEYLFCFFETKNTFFIYLEIKKIKIVKCKKKKKKRKEKRKIYNNKKKKKKIRKKLQKKITVLKLILQYLDESV
jgi:hypothetical protein